MSKQELIDRCVANGKVIKAISNQVPEKELSELFALYNQFKNGDNNTEKPTDAKDLGRWEAWNAKKGSSAETAIELLLERQKEVLGKYSK